MSPTICPRCNGEKQVVTAILYPDPPAKILTLPCPFCKSTGYVAGESVAEELLWERRISLEEAKQEIPWIRHRRVFAQFRELAGCTEFVVMGKRW